jgi:hypothetical protein
MEMSMVQFDGLWRCLWFNLMVFGGVCDSGLLLFLDGVNVQNRRYQKDSFCGLYLSVTLPSFF